MVRGRGQLPPDVAGLADAVGLGGAVEREGLHLDDQLVLGQQLSRQGQGLHGAAVGAATGDAGAGLAGGVVGDRDHLGRFGYQADQFPDGVLPATSRTASTAPPAAARTRSARPWP